MRNSLCVLLLLASCQQFQQVGEPEPAAKAVRVPPAVNSATEKTVVPAPSAAPEGVAKLPANLQLREENLFALDTLQEEFQLTLHGTRSFRLVGRLADEEGRRTIVLEDHRGGGEEVVFTADWLLPAVGATNAAGNMLVCVNRLVGESSDLTEGAMPDPTEGVDLVCRARNAGKWENEVVLGKGGAGQWIHDVTATADGGFRVSYNDDKTGLLVDDPSEGDGMYRVPFNDGRFQTPEMAAKSMPPM